MYWLFIFCFYFFVFKDPIEHIIPAISYSDELITLMAFPIFLIKLKRYHYKIRIGKWKIAYGRFVILFFILGLFASVIYKFQDFVKIALPDSFLCIKFWLAIYVGKNIFEGLSLAYYGERIYRHIKIISCIYLILFVLDQLLHIFPTNLRYGMRSTQLMYSQPTAFVACNVFIIMVLLSIKDTVRGSMKWLLILLFLTCSTLRSKAFGAVIAILMIYYFAFYRKKKVEIKTFIIFLPLIVAIAWDQIEYYFFSPIQSDSARYQLLVKAIDIAKDFFPFGTGFGTYASYYSGAYYSPVYALYDLTNINGLRPENTSFVSDSFWPMILGQTGVFGLASYCIALILLFMAIQKLRGVRLTYYAAALSGFCYLLISSMAESAFVHPIAVPIGVLIGVLINQKRIVYKKENE